MPTFIYLQNQVKYIIVQNCIKIWPIVFQLQAIFDQKKNTEKGLKFKGKMWPQSKHFKSSE